MKIASPHVVTCLLVMLTAPLSSTSLMGSDLNPSGSITTDRQTVLANSIVNVKWNANYPTPPVIRDTPPGAGVTPVTRVRADVRVLGAAFGPTGRPFPVRGWVRTSASSSSWTQIFLGNSRTYNPQTIVWSKVLAVGERLDFRFQGSTDNTYNLSDLSTISNWQQAIDTTASSPRPWNRSVLIDGENSPNYNPAFDQGDVHSHLKAYFYPGTTKVKLGPKDYIYLTELSEFSQGNEDTDMQDLVLLVTFTEVTTP